EGAAGVGKGWGGGKRGAWGALGCLDQLTALRELALHSLGALSQLALACDTSALVALMAREGGIRPIATLARREHRLRHFPKAAAAAAATAGQPKPNPGLVSVTPGGGWEAPSSLSLSSPPPPQPARPFLGPGQAGRAGIRPPPGAVGYGPGG
ncbi:unnamed protein product, partial [Discosporangium mesarthrocarpum]